MIDGRGEKPLENPLIQVEGDKIVSVTVGGNAPPGVEVVDLANATVLPGFIDAHVHLTGESSDNWFRDFFQGVMRFPAEQAHFAALYAKRTLQAGFTTVRNVGADDYVDLGLRNAINAGITTLVLLGQVLELRLDGRVAQPVFRRPAAMPLTVGTMISGSAPPRARQDRRGPGDAGVPPPEGS